MGGTGSYEHVIDRPDGLFPRISKGLSVPARALRIRVTLADLCQEKSEVTGS
jgi:hypothetical protein